MKTLILSLITLALLSGAGAVVYAENGGGENLNSVIPSIDANTENIKRSEERLYHLDRGEQFYLDYINSRARTIEIWLAVIGLIIVFFVVITPLAGLVAGVNFNKRIESLEEKAKDLALQAERHFTEIEGQAKEAEAYTKQLQAASAEVMDKEPEKIEYSIQRVLADSKSSITDKLMAEAYKAQRQGDLVRAVELWQSVSHNARVEKDTLLGGKAFSNLGYIYGLREKWDKSIKAYVQAIRLNPYDATAYHNRGKAYREKGKYEKAILDHNKAIELNPEYAAAYNNRGIAYSEKGNHEKAFQDYNKAIELNPNLAPVYNNRGIVYSDKGNYEKAVQDYNKAIELNPNLAPVYNNRGSAYHKQGNLEQAVQDYNKAIELDPNNPIYYRGRSAVHKAAGKRALAETDRKKAKELEKKLST